MRAVGLGLLAVGLMMPRLAEADTWQAMTELLPTSPKACGNEGRLYEFSLKGMRLSGRDPASKMIEGIVAADGSVSLRYESLAAVGTVTIAGNARLRQLEASANARPECRYSLKPGDGPPAQMQAGGEWAIGRWDGHVAVAGTSYSSMGLNSEARTLIIGRTSSGAVSCRWDTPQLAAGSPTKSCTIRVGTISLVTIASTTVELT
jgi:hypothetical protein